MLIDNDSLLNYLPKKLDPKQALILDGIRTCTHIIEESIRQLYLTLYQCSFDDNKPENYKAFISTWTIIDNSYRLYRLLLEAQKLIKFNINPEAIKKLKETEQLRHTFQHLDERIEQVFIKEQYPFLGQLSWIARKNIKDNEGYMFCMVCGYYPYKKQVFAPINPAGKSLRNNIDLITINSVGRKGKNSFDKVQLTIDSLLTSVKTCIKDVELILKKNESLFKIENSSDIDLVYTIKFEVESNQKIICKEGGQLFKRTKSVKKE